MHMWSNWGATRRPSLEGLVDVLGLRGKTARGSRVAEWWRTGDLDSIAAHCREDVRMTFRMFLTLTLQTYPDRYHRSAFTSEDKRNTEIIVNSVD
jgi:predicted PolB exonuclease-like 3'-5' exonuclease